MFSISYNLFDSLKYLYTSPTTTWINDVDNSVNPVVINLLLSRDVKLSNIVKYLNKYIYILDSKKFLVLAWSLIQPKFSRQPFFKKDEVIEDTTHYDFLLEKVKERLEISSNDWKYCKQLFLNNIKNNTRDYLISFGCSKKEWNKLGEDFNNRKAVVVKKEVEGLKKWF